MGTVSETSKETSTRKGLLSDRVKIGKGSGYCQGFYRCLGSEKVLLSAHEHCVFRLEKGVRQTRNGGLFQSA